MVNLLSKAESTVLVMYWTIEAACSILLITLHDLTRSVAQCWRLFCSLPDTSCSVITALHWLWLVRGAGVLIVDILGTSVTSRTRQPGIAHSAWLVPDWKHFPSLSAHAVFHLSDRTDHLLEMNSCFLVWHKPIKLQFTQPNKRGLSSALFYRCHLLSRSILSGL